MTFPQPRKLAKISAVAAVLVGVSTYALMTAQAYISGPILIVESPVNGETVASTSPRITVRGSAQNIAYIRVNGQQIFTDENGSFAVPLLLSPGYSIITVEAQDKFERSAKKELQLVVK